MIDRALFDTTSKGIPFDEAPAGVGWNLFAESAALPAAVLVGSAVAHNSAAMADYCRRHDVSLAPHGKTTMSPELFDIQLRDGAWAITAANVFQARVMKESGVPRVLIANEVAAPSDIAWLAEQADEGFPVLCYVDSARGVQLLDEGVSASTANRLDVLIELGLDGGRTGARTVAEALDVARAAHRSRALRVVGVAGFEGIIVATDTESAEERVDGFLSQLAELARSIVVEGLADESHELVVTAGGSVFFDQVVEQLGRVRADHGVRVVVRSGCYLSHDDGVIDDLSPLGRHARVAGDVFDAALEVWAPVLSRPEPGRIILGAGKRDLSTDGLFPLAKKWVRRGSRTVLPLDEPRRAFKVDDQHTYLEVDSSSEIGVGDIVGLGISHPCTTFDKWKHLLVVDSSYDVVDVATTRF